MLTMGCRGKCGVREANREYCSRSGKCSGLDQDGGGVSHAWILVCFEDRIDGILLIVIL